MPFPDDISRREMKLLESGDIAPGTCRLAYTFFGVKKRFLNVSKTLMLSGVTLYMRDDVITSFEWPDLAY